MSTNVVFRMLLLFAVLTAGVWLLGRPASLQPEGLARLQALDGLSTNDAATGAQSDGADVVVHAPVAPVSVNLADVPAGVGDGNSQYERWLRGEIDLDEEDNLISPAEKAVLQAAALDLPAGAGMQQMRSGPGLAAPIVGTAFDSLDYNDCCGGGGSVPPDPEMAAGPDHIIAVVNVAFEIYDKSGTSLVGPTTFTSFFNSLGGTNCTAGGPFDPNALYDEEADRFMMAVDGDGNAYCVAISQTNDPTGSWYLYEFAADVNGYFFDYPHAGVGLDAIYMGANMFNGNTYAESRIWAYDKSDLYAGAVVTPVSRSLGNDGTPQPINLHGYSQGSWPSSGPHYFLTDRNFNGETYALHAWTDPFGANTLTTLDVFDLPAEHGVAVGFPVDVVQLGGGTIQGNDYRPLDFEYGNGSGWTATTVSCNPGGGTVNCVQWAEIDLDSATLVQAGVIASSGDYRTFPDVAANHCGDMAVGYTKSSASIYPAVWATGRRSVDALGTMQAEVEVKAGEISYTAFDGAPRRWGDYSGMTIDPDGETFWYLGEYSKDTSTTNGRWGTYIAALSFPDCEAPATDPQIHVDPASLQGTQGANSVVTHTLTISNSGTTDLTWTIDEAQPLQPATSDGSPLRILPESIAAPEMLARDFDLAPLVDVITDGGFEGGTPNAAWDEGSTNFGSPLCTVAGCGTGGGTGPHSGSWWAWFGGIAGVAETGYVRQDVIIPVGAAELSFWLEIPAAGTTGFLNVEIDGNVLATYTESDAATYATYQQVILDVSAYADGSTHNVAFESTTDAGAGALNFFIDDVVLDSQAGCDAPSDIPWASVSPAAGTTAYNTEDVVNVVFDATGLSTGVYSGTLCIDSNDPATPRVEVPLEMTVEPTDYGVDLSGNEADSGSVGSTVTYTLQITNTGNSADTFDLSVSGNLWSTTFSQSSVALAVGASTTVEVWVEVPSGATVGDADTTLVTATSQGDPGESDTLQLTTTATAAVDDWYVYLPAIFNP